MQERGTRIIVATSSWKACVGWETARRELLRNCFNIPSRNVVITEDKSVVHGDVFVDDKTESVADWLRAHPRRDDALGVVMSRPWSRSWSASDAADRAHFVRDRLVSVPNMSAALLAIGTFEGARG